MWAAGHLPPVLTTPAQPGARVCVPVDAPLGLRRTRPTRHTTTLDPSESGLLVCYTDGLVERRGEIIDAGIDRLASAVHPGSAEETCAKITALLGLEQPDDDIAVLAVHRRSTAATM